MKKLLPIIIIATLFASGCSSTRTVEQQVAASNDPLESVNRSLWTFNWEYLDKYLLRPVSIAYVEHVPDFARKGLLNAAENLEEPSNAVNNLLQGKVVGTATSLGRFVLNSTVGLLGTIDVASSLGLEPEQEEFGETLAVWGAGTGYYLMAPGMGPTDVRSATGDIVDTAYFPLADLNIYVSVFRTAIKAMEARGNLVQQEQLLNDSLDSYSLIKDIYFQNLQNKVNDGVVEPSAEELSEDDELEDLLEDF